MTSCYNEDYCFMHIPKCAGTSIGGSWNPQLNLWQNSWLADNFSGMTRRGFPNGHQPVSRITEFTGRQISSFKMIIVTIRNPYEQQLSQYRFWRTRGQQQAKEGYNIHVDDQFALECETLSDFVLDRRSNGPNVGRPDWKRHAGCGDQWKECGGVYKWWIIDEQGRIPPNVRVIRVEDLPDALYALWPERDDLTPLGRENRTDPEKHNVTLSEAAHRHIRAKFAWSIAWYYPELAKQTDDMLASV